MRSILIILFVFFLSITLSSKANTSEDLNSFSLCPLCSRDGQIICPVDYEAGCSNEKETSEPKCIFYGDKYVPGCLRFVGIKKLDFQMFPPSAIPGAMIEIIGGGETYELNRELVGCRRKKR